MSVIYDEFLYFAHQALMKTKILYGIIEYTPNF